MQGTRLPDNEWFVCCPDGSTTKLWVNEDDKNGRRHFLTEHEDVSRFAKATAPFSPTVSSIAKARLLGLRRPAGLLISLSVGVRTDLKPRIPTYRAGSRLEI